jgi:voltage-gated potassium channel
VTQDHTRRWGLRHRFGDQSEYYRLRRRLGIAFGALAGVITAGTVGFAIIGAGEHGLIDAVYMTIITLTTVGFGEIIDMSNNPAGRVFTVFILLSGMGIVAYSVPLMAAFIIEGQLFHPFARRRMEKRIAQLVHHYIVCGEASAASYVTEELMRTGREVILVTPNDDSLPQGHASLDTVPRITGDPTDDPTLLGANLQSASGVIACMESDKDNLLVVLTARRLSPRVRIVAATERADRDLKLRAAGADAVVCASRIGGLRMASEMVRPKVVSFLDRMLRDTRSSLRVEEITVPEGYSSSDMKLDALKIRDLPGVMLLAVQAPESGVFNFKPSGDTLLEAGMALIIMADAEGRARLEKALQ